MTSPSPGIALVTGASSGIGAIYAERLARRGYDLILVARSGERLRAEANRIRSQTGRAVTALVADLGVRSGVADVEAVLRDDARINLLVNNAGIGATAPLLASDVERMSAMIALNVEALMRLCYAAAPALVARGGGAIVNIASVVAIAPELLNGVYGATKSFVLALSRSMHHELARQGVHVQAVLPGPVATDFWDAAGTPLESLPRNLVMSAEDLVDAALSGLDQGEAVTLPGLADATLWRVYEEARQALGASASSGAPAARYRPLALPT